MAGRHLVGQPHQPGGTFHIRPRTALVPIGTGREATAWATAQPPPRPGQAAPGALPDVVFLSGEPDSPGHQYRVVRMAASAALVMPTVILPRARGHMRAIERARVLWIWRAAMDDMVEAAIAAARRGGARIIFDVDDLMIDPSLAQPSVIDGLRTQRVDVTRVADHFARMRQVMLAADMCVATTEELAAHMRAAGKPAMVIPNGFDYAGLAAARLVRDQRPNDGLLRIGYATGSRTHQRDFVACADGLARFLRRTPEARLVLFHSDKYGRMLEPQEYAQLHGLADQIEWRQHGTLDQLPAEMARFDINIAPLEVGNPFCEAKSELKFWEAALVGVPTIASPTGPFERAIGYDDGFVGILAEGPADWFAALTTLAASADVRSDIADAARYHATWTYGPERRAELVAQALDLVRGGARAASAFATQVRRAVPDWPAMPIDPVPETRDGFRAQRHARAEVTVVVPLHNYARYLIEALESVRQQTVADLDLVIVDDASTDHGLGLAIDWARANARRFGEIAVLTSPQNGGVSAARNIGAFGAKTAWVLPLDADNVLRPDCVARCLAVAKAGGAAFVYPAIQQFGDAANVIGTEDYNPVRLIGGNFVDAMAMISRAAWARAGGYCEVKDGIGLEDFDLWCRMAELGFRGERVPGAPLAEYRVHAASMSREMEAGSPRALRTIEVMKQRHPWLRLP